MLRLYRSPVTRKTVLAVLMTFLAWKFLSPVQKLIGGSDDASLRGPCMTNIVNASCVERLKAHVYEKEFGGFFRRIFFS